MRIAVLNAGSFGEQAAKIFAAVVSGRCDFMYCRRHKDVINQVANGLADYGVVAFRNSSSPNVVGESMAYLAIYSDIAIIGFVSLPVDICLAANNRVDLKSIAAVHSHAQGFIQCSRLLAGMDVREIEHPSTAAAASFVVTAGQDSEAVLCSGATAAKMGLTVLFAYAANAGRENQTDFFVISKKYLCPAPTHAAVVVRGIENRPGGLRDLLNAFAGQGINLDYIHSDSRPLQFFVLIETPAGKSWSDLRESLNGHWAFELKGEYCLYAS